ncbi:MAG: hypothetical protein HY675_02885 [Chloroflexi bacterium]|nr:hypothetical protein [Chloroflexota bacterium]
MPNLEPEDFEAGENVTDQVRRSKPGGIVVSVRLMPEDSVKLVDLAEESGQTISQVARQAIRSFLSRRAQHPVFAPEITGETPIVDIVTFAPLGPRTANERNRVEEMEEAPQTSRTTALVGAA